MGAPNASFSHSRMGQEQLAPIPTAQVTDSCPLVLPPRQHQLSRGNITPPLGPESSRLPPLSISSIDSARTEAGKVEPRHFSWLHTLKQGSLTAKNGSSPQSRRVLTASQLPTSRAARNAIVPVSPGNTNAYPTVSSIFGLPQTAVDPDEMASVHWCLAFIAAVELALKIYDDKRSE